MKYSLIEAIEMISKKIFVTPRAIGGIQYEDGSGTKFIYKLTFRPEWWYVDLADPKQPALPVGALQLKY